MATLVRSVGDTTSENSGPKKPAHSMHPGIDAQSSMALPDGWLLCGQQSAMSSIADMSSAIADMSIALTEAPAWPAAGSMATDQAIRSATMMRAMLMARPRRRENRQ